MSGEYEALLHEEIMQRAMAISHERHGSPVLETHEGPYGPIQLIPCHDVTDADIEQAMREVLGR